jgi:proteasome lid subunit RPN8/RPN11
VAEEIQLVKTPELPTEWSVVLRHLESTYPNEGCGVILRGPEGWRAVPLKNDYDRYKAVDPEGFPRTSRTAYFFNPKEFLQVTQEAEKRGEQVAIIFHSHGDVGAYFSAEDKAMAAPEGEPLHPGMTYVVCAVNGGKAEVLKAFWWEGGDFQEVAVPLG